ncbi:MAG: type II secretion system protein GspD [Candidatus Parabeggiatoa sp. nov. 2]|nr:MAG: type II secretion system protein GspD [Beggiatoa sp. 4572_84]RKZ60192.1 MAG: type II secretion system protein GspD [Gammaproteobacteria bacterium]HEC86092.1 type II secretion system protein GspD [Thioploca sp.]
MLFTPHNWLCYILFCLLFSLSANAEEVTLNFRETDIKDIVNIISEVTGKTFVVDPRVKGKVTVVSNQPMDGEQVYEVFLSILSVHGFTAIPSGAVIKIVPENIAKSQNTPVLSANEAIDGETLITQVVQIKHVSAAQLIPLLRPLIRQQGHLVAYPANNTLVISDHANNVRRLLKIIRRIDRAEDEDIEVMVLGHASAAEVVRILTQLEQAQATRAKGTKSTFKIVADERTNSVLLSGDSATRLRLRTLITHLDTPIKSEGLTQVIYLRYAQAKNLVKVLKGVSESFTEAEKGKGQLDSKQSVKTNIQADESTNSLVITATPKVLQNLLAVIRQLDVRPAQVLVEAVIAEVSTDMARELGVQWLLYGKDGTTPLGLSNFDNTGTRIIDLASAAYRANQSSNVTLPNIGAGAFLGLGRFNSSILNFAVLLRALDADINTNVLSTPSLLTLDNQEAEIVVGQNVPFVTGQYTNTGAIGNVTNPFQTIQREDIGIKLKVKPQINEGNAVKLEIEQEVSSISRSSVATTDIVTNKRTIKTTVIIEDGNMVVLGGLIDEDLQQTTQKVPGLGDLPLIGGLFRSQTTKKVKRNLMVFLHPVIMRDAASDNIISSGKYSYMRAKQLEQKAQGLPLMSADQVPVLPDLDDFLTVLPGDQGFFSAPIEPQRQAVEQSVPQRSDSQILVPDLDDFLTVLPGDDASTP